MRMELKLGTLALVPAFCCVQVQAQGDPAIGRQLYAQRCSACHSLDVNLAGPAHRGVYGRKAGSAAGFDYSPALKNSQVVWNDATLDQWLAGPDRFIPGQKMWVSVPDPDDRKNLNAYLKSVSAK
jgi:cytochrome c